MSVILNLLVVGVSLVPIRTGGIMVGFLEDRLAGLMFSVLPLKMKFVCLVWLLYRTSFAVGIESKRIKA